MRFHYRRTVKQATRPTRWLIGAAASFSLFLVLWGSTARAHVVPPEKFHPVTEAYLRSVFLVNLNPIPWKELRADCKTMAGALETHGSRDPEAQRTLKELRHSLVEAGRPRKEDEEYSADTYRRECFTACTRGISWLTRHSLAQAVSHLTDHSVANEELRRSRQLFQSFEDSIRVCDPESYGRLGEAWLECSNALGHPGIGGIGRVDPDPELMRRSTAIISSYLKTNYEDVKLPARGRLTPVPYASSSYVAGSVTPLRLPPGTEVNKQNPRPRQILNMVARGVDESDTYLVALGDMAFDSSVIFGEPARSLGVTCNMCHNKGTTNPKFFIPGLSHQKNAVDVSNIFFNPRFNNGQADPLDIPDMRGLRFTGPYGRNGRFASLREFTRNVIVNEFAGPEPDPEILDGLVAYQFEFDFLPNPYLNRNGTLTAKASPAAKRGEQLFVKPFAGMANKSCASCHVPSAHFVDRLAHDVGSGNPAESSAIDTAFDTPTLLNVKFSAPYFHDGSLPTLRAVNEWFNRRYKLGLTQAQINDLTAYVETVGDGKDAYEAPGSIVAPELEEFSFFLSALEHAIPEHKKTVVVTTGRTVAFEVRAHKWDLRDTANAPHMDRLADLAESIAVAAERDDWKRAMQCYRDYVTLYEKHKAELQ